jgi:HSP20 family molecular chaperone IbpA
MNARETVAEQGGGRPGGPEPTRTAQVYRPNVDILELPDELVIRADLPGVSSDRIEIHFEDGSLTLKGQVGARPEPRGGYVLREYGVGDFHRVFAVNEQVDAARINAEYADGVLTVRLPKVEAARPRKIAVQAR